MVRSVQLDPSADAARRGEKPSIRTFPYDTTDIFGGKRLTARDREHLATISTRLRLRSGAFVFERGDPATAVYTIAEGSATSFRPIEGNARRVMAFLFAEDLFGLARAGKYVNTVVALTPLTVFRLPLGALKTMLLRNPELQLHFLCKVTHALREAQRQAILMGCRDPLVRTARFLGMLEHAQPEREPGTISLPMTRRDIGDYLNLTGAAVTSALRELEKRRMLALVDTGDVRILDREGLEGLIGEI
jgi:CRP/FNR family nitrogen fixation transcriptional regulator